jgi:cardiolipin synthase A/B
MLAALYILMSTVVDDHAAVWLLLGADLVALASVPSVLLRRRGRPVAALSWLLAVAVLPYAGVILWWTLGRTHLDRLRRRRLRRPVRAPRTAGSRLSTMPFYNAEYRGSDGIFAPTGGNDLQLLVDAEFMDALRAAIRDAEVEIDLLFYIWQDDATGTEIRDLLAERARHGVRVRVLVDDMGSPAMRGRFARPLLTAGAQVLRFLPVRFRPWNPTLNFRNHRKLVVIDHKVALTGGVNIGTEYESHWHDLGLRVRGPAVCDLHEVFCEDWEFARGRKHAEYACLPMESPPCAEPAADGVVAIVASGPDRDRQKMADTFFLAIGSAKERVFVTTPYFIPTEPIQAVLRSAAQRGVDVRLMVPRRSDVQLVQLASRPYYQELLEEGVRIFEYEPRTLHAKAIVVDDDLAVLGSANVDLRSFRLNFELVCVAESHTLAHDLAVLFARNQAHCHEVHLEELAATGIWGRLAESVAHLVSPLL